MPSRLHAMKTRAIPPTVSAARAGQQRSCTMQPFPSVSQRAARANPTRGRAAAGSLPAAHALAASLATPLRRPDTLARAGASRGSRAQTFQPVRWNRIWPAACYTNTSSMWNQPAQGPFRRFAAAQVDGAGGASAPDDAGPRVIDPRDPASELDRAAARVADG